MYDVKQPLLVFETQTLRPLTNEFSGYIFQLFEWSARKPRPLFFSTMAEAQMFSARYGAVMSMNPRHAPEEVTALDYVSNHDPFVENRGSRQASGGHGMDDLTQGASVDGHWLDEPGLLAVGSPDDPEPVGDVGDIDFFGEE